MGTTLHELAQDFLPIKDSLEQMLLDGEIDEQTFTDTIESVALDVDLKIENVAKFILHLDSLSEGMSAAITSMQNRKKAIDSRVSSLRAYLTDSMIAIGYEKFEKPDIRLSFRKSSSVVIDDERQLGRFITEKVTTTYSKAEIGRAIKSGEKVDGAHLQENKNLQIN